MSINLVGLNAFSKTVLCFIINQVKKGFSLEKFFQVFLFVTLVSLANQILTIREDEAG